MNNPVYTYIYIYIKQLICQKNTTRINYMTITQQHKLNQRRLTAD